MAYPDLETESKHYSLQMGFRLQRAIPEKRSVLVKLFCFSAFFQILAKHENETKALQSLLRETRMCRDNLARRLQASERKLLSTKDALHHLQRLSQDQSLLEKEELTLRLARATTQLQDKDRRIQV